MIRLLSIASESISASKPSSGSGSFSGEIGEQLFALLSERNGFYAFGSALHVFPSGSGAIGGYSLEEWNSSDLWVSAYGSLAPDALFFAEDIFGGQFCVFENSIHKFDPETAELVLISGSVDDWMGELISDYNYMTGYSIGERWQANHFPIPSGHRLAPRTPFILGGDFSLENFVLVHSRAALNYWGKFAVEVSSLKDGAQFRFYPERIERVACAGRNFGGRFVCECIDLII